MNTKGQMNPTSRVSITASQAGENSQTNGSVHTIISSILTDPIFKRSNWRRAESSNPPLNQRSSRVRATSFKILNWHKYHHQLQLILESYKLKTKRMFLIHWICWSKSLLKSQWINLHQIWRLKLFWKHIKHEQNCLQTDLTMIRPTPKLPWESDHERNRNFGCTSETINLTSTWPLFDQTIIWTLQYRIPTYYTISCSILMISYTIS